MRFLRRVAPIAVAALTLAACGKEEKPAADSPAASSPAESAAMPASQVLSTGDKAFLEQMIDHHHAMAQMAYDTRGRISDPEVTKDSDRLHMEESAERDTMIALLKRDFGESYTAKIPATMQPVVDSLAKLRGRFLAKTFYEFAAAHHKEGIAMIDHYLPTLRNPAVKKLAEQMKAEQQAEVKIFEQKAPTKGPIDPRAEGEVPGL